MRQLTKFEDIGYEQVCFYLLESQTILKIDVPKYCSYQFPCSCSMTKQFSATYPEIGSEGYSSLPALMNIINIKMREYFFCRL